MKKEKFDCIEINRVKYRITFNWNSTANFLSENGFKFANIEFDKLEFKHILSLLYHGILEGCRIQGTKFPFTQEDFGAMLNPETIHEMFTIYVAQNKGNMNNSKQTG